MYGQERIYVGQLLPKSQWGDGESDESTDSDTETSNESNSEPSDAEPSDTTSFTINHGFIVDSITVNGSRFGSSHGGSETTIELETDEKILSVSAKRVRKD